MMGLIQLKVYPFKMKAAELSVYKIVSFALWFTRLIY